MNDMQLKEDLNKITRTLYLKGRGIRTVLRQRLSGLLIKMNKKWVECKELLLGDRNQHDLQKKDLQPHHIQCANHYETRK